MKNKENVVPSEENVKIYGIEELETENVAKFKFAGLNWGARFKVGEEFIKTSIVGRRGRMIFRRYYMESSKDWDKGMLFPSTFITLLIWAISGYKEYSEQNLFMRILIKMFGKKYEDSYAFLGKTYIVSK